MPMVGTATESFRAEARNRATQTPLEDLDPGHWDYFEFGVAPKVLGRLRREAPIHRCERSANGSYWSITRFEDVRSIELDPARFSSEGTVSIVDRPFDLELPMFIAMDPPKHDEQRRVVFPALAPKIVRAMEGTIRERAAAILDALPIGETFDWVERVSIELTTQMLATLFDFPFEERHKLTRWSDVASGGIAQGIVDSKAQRRDEFQECLARFEELWKERAAREPSTDFISMMAHAPATKDMLSRPMELLGNVLLLIVGGNDTTRNSISGGVYALNQFPEQYDKLRANPGVIRNMASEIIRWQTPLAHMRRTATEDVDFQGHKISAGDTVILWYLSANRDESIFPDGGRLVVDRKNANHHISYGFGIHRCVGAHLADMQIRVLWEEIVQRFEFVEVMEEPSRTRSNLINGYTRMPVRVHAR
jgi:cytochrome P450